MAFYDQASKTQGRDSEMIQKVSGNFRVPHFTPCLVRMLRSSIEYSSKAHAEITTMYIYIYVYCIILLTQIQWMFLLSPEDSTLTLFRHGTISKIVHPTSRLLVFHISFSPKKGNRDLFRSFFRWVLRLFVPLVLLFQFLGFCLWKCQASIFGQVLKLEDFPKSTN